MIFVTLGTHEQPFNRLIKEIDELRAAGTVTEEVVVQTGYSTYEPASCTSRKLFGYDEMVANMEKARIIITHGGPSSFLQPLQMGKIPVVVPRQKAFGEHVNDHQVDFCRKVYDRYKNIIVVEDIATIKDVILNYDDMVGSMPGGIKSNNAAFVENFKKIVDEL